MSPSPMTSPADKDPATRPLRRGDLVRVSEAGLQKSKRLKDREGHLGRISKVDDGDDDGCSCYYDVEWVLGGRLSGCSRRDLTWTCAELEGMTYTSGTRRDKRKPVNFMQEVMCQDKAKKQKKQQQQQAAKIVEQAAAPKKKAVAIAKKQPAAAPRKGKLSNSKPAALKGKTSNGEASAQPKKKPGPKRASEATTTMTTKNSKKQKVAEEPDVPIASTGTDLYERHRRDFERCIVRLEEKIDCFRHFWEEAPVEFDERYDDDAEATTTEADATTAVGSGAAPLATSPNEASGAAPPLTTQPSKPGSKSKPSATSSSPYPSHAPFNWEMIRRRASNGRYVLDRRKMEEEERFELLRPYYASLGKKRPYRTKRSVKADNRVLYPKGIDWELFRTDVFAMCAAALSRQSPVDKLEDDGLRGSMSYTVKKVEEALQQAVERTGSRHAAEMAFADDRHKFALAVEASNTEPAMQSWRKVPFPERKYERLTADVVCAGLSDVDEKIAAFELKTNLPDSFIGQSYRYDDTGQSEAWMKSVVDETGSSNSKSKKKNSSNQKADEERLAALALSADEGVTRAQVSATMQSLLIAVQDKVMTEGEVLRQPELRSANWIADVAVAKARSDDAAKDKVAFDAAERPNLETSVDVVERRNDTQSTDSELLPEIIEQPVWGIDCYTRRNILNCLDIEFDSTTSLLFVEKWLLPAINACPKDLGHNIANAARILEGLPFEEAAAGEESQENAVIDVKQSMETWSESLLGRALIQKINASGPPWLKAAANQLRRARAALGPDFFRVHPKGHGSVVLSPSLKANALVTFYHGELYPSWRWGEKMDAIEITQTRKDLKPALPDFYNMALERPQTDPRGYGLLFVDASRKAGHGSSLSHSCAPTCEVRVAAFEGELCLAMTTLRELEMGEELTFDYNAVTESLNEYRSAVCLCGYGRCRGSFLHFATADCYQQVLNRNSPIAARFASLVKGSMKQVMSPDDEQVLRNHGFLTAAFGAISVNRGDASLDGHGESLVDSLDMVPVWLRTYVADTLRYIEYERRALPIALICDHLSASKKEGEKSSASQLMKEPKPEPAFFYFSRTESDFILNVLKKEGFPDCLTGLQLKHTMQKVASSYWNALTEEKKQYWKNKARADFDKKIKAWRARNKKRPAAEKKQAKERCKPKIDEILHSSKISFQDADAEGMVAMEQRIQQLTQSLSRIGRVLDRHREGSFDSDPERKRVQSPLRVLADAEVVGWMWNNRHGVVPSLIRAVGCSRCVRPHLLESLSEVRRRFSSLETFGDPERSISGDMADQPADGRLQLTVALLALRSIILRELKEMAKDFRQMRTQCSLQLETRSQNSSEMIFSDDESEGKALSVFSEPASGVVASSIPEADASALPVSRDDLINSKASLAGEVATEATIDAGNFGTASMMKSSKNDTVFIETCPWLDFYGERFTLHAAADLLLLYARTSNFFKLQPYQALQSTPVAVYARELGNVVPRSVIDVGLTDDSDGPTTVAVGRTPVKEGADGRPAETQESNGHRSTDNSTSPADLKRNATDLCAPDDIVAKVSVRYQGDYVLSQLLQWYNAGIGQKPGLPDLLGCTLLPSMSECWSSHLLKNSKLKADRKTSYETKVRPRLVEWLQDPYQRGNPWPQEIRKAFVGDESSKLQRDTSALFLPFGSPIIDFLVTGDESNITSVLNELDADDKIAAKKSGDGLLSSVDKGRPAQAVSTWVQCEHPECMKWRKIPWYVDADLLPERFFCKDNKWNPGGNNCDAPEDDWDSCDALVGSDGKVEGSPVKMKKAEENLSVLDEASFSIGTRFDVQRSGKDKYSIATVAKVDFSGSKKRIMFQFAKSSLDRDEWIEFGSPRIAPLYSKVPKKGPKSGSRVTQASAGISYEDIKKPAKVAGSKPAASKTPRRESGMSKGPKPKKEKFAADPDDEMSFKVGARFDVHRHEKNRYYFAVVKEVDFSGPVKKILFHFAKTSDKFDEWIQFGSPRIFPLNSKVVLVKKEKKPKKIKEELSAEKQLSVAAATISKAVLAQSQPQISHDCGVKLEDEPLPQVSVASEAHESQPMDATTFAAHAEVESTESGVSGAIPFRQMTGTYGKQTVSCGMFVEREPRYHASAGLTSFTSSLSHSGEVNGSHRIPRSFVEESRSSSAALNDTGSTSEATAPLGSFVSTDRTMFNKGNSAPSSAEKYPSHQYNGYASHSFGTAVLTTQPSPAPARPPDFTTAPRNVALGFGSQQQQYSGSSSNGHSFLAASRASVPSVAPAFGLSGLDMLAAVTNQHAFGTSMNEVLNTNHLAPSAGHFAGHPHGFGRSSFLQSDASQALALMRFGLQQREQHQLDPSSFGQNQTNSGTPSSDHHYGW